MTVYRLIFEIPHVITKYNKIKLTVFLDKLRNDKNGKSFKRMNKAPFTINFRF